ncbi:MAG: Na+/H+ antiporter subunit E [Acidimicrobiales bacterium]
MNRRPAMADVIAIVLLTAVWCALWGAVSVANLLTGVVIATIAVARRPSRSRTAVRLTPLLQLGWLILLDLVSSTLQVVREVLTPTDYSEEGIIAVQVPSDSMDHTLLLTSAITLTPGTAVVEIDRDRSTLYLHLLHMDRRAQVEEHVVDLARLAIDALPCHHPVHQEAS